MREFLTYVLAAFLLTWSAQLKRMEFQVSSKLKIELLLHGVCIGTVPTASRCQSVICCVVRGPALNHDCAFCKIRHKSVAVQPSSQGAGVQNQPADSLLLLPAGIDSIFAEAANSGLGRKGGGECAQQSIHVAGVL